jgi:phosphatidylglycerophosphate synthase
MIQVSTPKFNERASPAARIVGQSTAKIYGLTQEERLRRALRRAGAQDPLAKGAPAATATTVLVRADHVFEERLLADLVRTPGCMLVTGTSEYPEPAAAHVDSKLADLTAAWLKAHSEGAKAARAAGLALLTASELATMYDEKLRKKSAPYIGAVRPRDLPEIEAALFAASYKGVTDFVTKYVWPIPARVATKWCAEHAVTPNVVTALSALCVLGAMWMFAQAWWVPGLVLAWLMTFLDTVDGKLARVTLTSSKLGNAFDHGVDLIHPPFWYYAWWQGLAAPDDALLRQSLWVVMVGYVIGRLLEGWFLAVHKMEIHAWRPVDSFFRLITARRNPNLAILTIAVAIGSPREGFLVVALWTIASLAFHAVRILEGARVSRAGRPPKSWLSE